MTLRSAVSWACASIAVLASAGCIPSTHPPERLFAPNFELGLLRNAQTDLAARYYGYLGTDPEAARQVRNEIIAQRMYAIDIQFVQYEAALTKERQEIGFGTVTAAQGLSTAATLAAPGTTQILSGVSAAILATKGHYENEVLMAQTIRTIQKQMRASRAFISAGITARMVQSVADYPLAVALGDVEEYYSAGTLTSGVIDTSTTVGIEESRNKNLKQEVATAPPEDRATVVRAAAATKVALPLVQQPTVIVTTSRPDAMTSILSAWLSPNGVLDRARRTVLRDYIATIKSGLAISSFLDSPQYATQRVTFARAQKLIP